jgi:hypothetical protein
MKMIMLKNLRGNVSIMLILVIVVLTTITTAAVALAVSTMRDTTTYTLGERTLAVAESGAENAILRLLRDPTYTGESNLPIGPGTATITVTGSSPKIITSTASIDMYTRAIEVTLSNVAGQLVVSGWREL